MLATAKSIFTPRFVRKTSLQPHERNTNFTMFDNEIMAAVSSLEADAITPLMSKIYLRLKAAPRQFFETDGVLRFTGEEREGKWVTAWEQLRQHLRVSSETANKALSWMHDEGIIGYSAFKNGVGIRIFLNRAASSIGVRPVAGSSGELKNLRFPHASVGENPTSVSEVPFKDRTHKKDLEEDINSAAPKNGANETTLDKTRTGSDSDARIRPTLQTQTRAVEISASTPNVFSMNEIIERLRHEIEPCLKTAATHAAGQAAAREMAHTRQWFETKALPKAVRVAQSETYNLLKKLGTLNERQERARADLQVGHTAAESCAQLPPLPLDPKAIAELAETCVALLEMQNKTIDTTLSEMSSEGGWLLPSDRSKVRAEAESLLSRRAVRK